MKISRFLTVMLIVEYLFAPGCQNSPKELERPERIVSIREVMYDSATYGKLAQLWKEYYDVYPSEDAYANWMYATNEALGDNYGQERKNYRIMVEKGVSKYPSNSTLLYLLAGEKRMLQNDLESLQLLEKGAALDPANMDPWFSLVPAYLYKGDREKADGALRKLLEGGAVDEEVMDFCYNMLASLDTNAILITNGDNGTFPAWILTRVVKFRPDVNVVNRALLNADGYSSAVVKEGVPPFITKAEFDSLGKQVSADFLDAMKRKLSYKEVANRGDRLVARIIEAAERVSRPVYFSCTQDETSNLIDSYTAQGRNLGLVTLITPAAKPYQLQLRELFRRWMQDFRTGGLDSWQLRFSKDSRSGRILSQNYATALFSLRGEIEAAGPDVQLALFRWYRDHVLGIIPQEISDNVNTMWYGKKAPREIQEWCRAQGIVR